MKKYILALAVISTVSLTACDAPSETYNDLEFVDKFETSKSGELFQFKDNEGEEHIFNVDSKDNFFLHKGSKYDVEVSVETWYQYADYIDSLKESK